MKVYVAGQLDDTGAVEHAYTALRAAGHAITYDWTTDAYLRDYPGHRAEAARRAVNDIQGVIDADVFVLLSGNQRAGKGMYAELGAALALHKTTGRPRIYLVGNLTHVSIFYFHPAVIYRPDIESVIAGLPAAN